jgi:enamine deaminase RidA (YjgF/YER057c/UK114 family)
MQPEDRIAELGLDIPPATGLTAGLYTPVVIAGDLAFTSGSIAIDPGPPRGIAYVGALGADLTVEEGRASARGAMIITLANLRAALGDLNRVERFVKVTGFVRAIPDFTEMPKVVDGASELLVDIWGDDLRSARSAIGVAALPGGASVEIESIVQLRPSEAG